MKLSTKLKNFILRKVMTLDRKNILPLECTFYEENNCKGEKYIWGLLISRSHLNRFIYAKARATDMGSLIDKLMQKTICQQRRTNKSSYSRLRESDFLYHREFSNDSFSQKSSNDFYIGENSL